MRNLLNPKWIFIINTLPAAILFFLLYNDYSVIKSLLSGQAVSMWFYYAITLGILTVMNFSYALFMIFRRKQVEWIYPALGLGLHIIYLLTYYINMDRMVPFTIPGWMMSGDFYSYAGTFLMPTLIYFLFVLVIYSIRKTEDVKPWKSFIAAIAVPLLFYLFGLVIVPLLSFSSGRIMTHLIIIFVVCGVTFFLFFLARGLYIIAIKKSLFSYKYQLIWKVLVSIIFPLAGLMLNVRLFGGVPSGVFGDFSSSWFYVLAVVNGFFICLPAFEKVEYRLALFSCRCIMFSYTLYFFVVFLPFLPLSIFAVLAAGLGFLMLTPFALFITHINILSDDFSFLARKYSKKLLALIIVIGMAVIPTIIHLNFIRDKKALNQALDYMYTPDYSKKYNIDKNALAKAIQKVKLHKEVDPGNSRIASPGDREVPFISAYYTWLVLDNLTLSNSKINDMERVFWGKAHKKIEPLENLSENVVISKINSNSKFDAEKDCWISWVDMEITNNNDINNSSEYLTKINLPDGCWISDYYLYVGKRKEMGILAEKRAAMWVYSQIRTVRKDPGILYYLTGNKVVFRVFPFTRKEVRRTGIEFIHKEPVTLKFDDNVIRLGDDKDKRQINNIHEYKNGDVIFVSAKEKQNLPEVQRAPYYHFIVDTSAGTEKFKKGFIQRIEKLLKRNLIQKTDFCMSFVNTYVETLSSSDSWKQRLELQNNEGGFYLDRAIRTILFRSYENKSSSYPAIVIVTDNINKAVLEKDFLDLKIAFPESNLFYRLSSDGGLIPHSLISNPKKVFKGNFSNELARSVYAYPDNNSPIAYLPVNNKSSILLKKDIFNVDIEGVKTKGWRYGLIMQGKWISQTLHPETSSSEWLNLVKLSFMTRIMSPLTSYLVVENEAQKAVLKRKQEKILSSSNTLDVGDEVKRMSEPNLFIMLLFIISFIVLSRIKARSISVK